MFYSAKEASSTCVDDSANHNMYSTEHWHVDLDNYSSALLCLWFKCILFSNIRWLISKTMNDSLVTKKKRQVSMLIQWNSFHKHALRRCETLHILCSYRHLCLYFQRSRYLDDGADDLMWTTNKKRHETVQQGWTLKATEMQRINNDTWEDTGHSNKSLNEKMSKERE